MKHTYKELIFIPYILEIQNIYSDKRFVNLDDGSQGGTHWCTFYVKNNKSIFFDSFGFQPENILLNQLPKPIINHNYKIQDLIMNYAKSCGYFCLYFFYLIERMKYYEAFLKLYFEYLNADKCIW